MKTWGELKLEIQTEMNIEGEDFVSANELMTWANDAKDEAEAEIVSLFDKYLETETHLTMVEGSDVVDLPADIFANKLTGLWYESGASCYEVRMITRKRDIFLLSQMVAGADQPYRFYFDNSAVNGIKLKLVPQAKESSTNLRAFYIRESQPIVDDTSLMDIPIADAFIKQYVKDKVREAEIGPMPDKGRSQLLEKQHQLLIEALNQMVPSDSADEMNRDISDSDDFGDYHI